MTVIRKAIIASGILAAVAGVASPAMASAKDAISSEEKKLLAAGFELRPANTPARQTMLARLPKEKFIRRVNGSNVAYVYADPKHCNCLFVGTQQAYGAYERAKQAARIADEQEDAALAYQDSNWDWGAWGPWGGRWGRFGFGYHRGW